MRLAFVVSSSYSESGKVAQLWHAEPQAEQLAQRLSEADAGFVVHGLRAERGLAEALEATLAAVETPPSSVLFYFSGYAVVSEEDVPSLLLDGERLSTLSLKRVRRLLGQSTTSLVVLDTVSAFDGEHAPDAMVRMFDEVVAGARAGIHLLASHRSEQEATGPSPFGQLFALALDWQQGAGGLDPEGLYAAMRREESLYSLIPRAELFGASTNFQLLLPQTARVHSLAPSPAFVPDDGAVHRADALVESGDLEGALDQYTLALAHLGEAPTSAHPELYAKIAGVLARVGRENDAVLYYEAALDLAPDLVPALEGAADLSAKRGDRDRALSLLTHWLAVDPNALVAAERVAPLFAAAEDWGRLAALYESVLARVSEPAAAAELALKIDELYLDYVGDEARSRTALERGVALAPADSRLRLRLANLYEKRGQLRAALEHLQHALRASPSHVAGYRTALRLFDRTRRPDGAWNSACALEVLGEADVNESLLADAHRPEGLVAAKGTIGADAWASRVLCPERDAGIDALFGALGNALVEVGLETAQRKRRSVSLDPNALQDPATSTTMLLKTFAWSTRLLGMDLPKVYVAAEFGAPFLVPPERSPTLVVSKALGSGLEMAELAFLWCRQLVLLRPEHRAIVFFPSVAELAALLLATLSLGGVSQLPFKKLEDDAKLFARSLKRHLAPADLSLVESLSATFPLRDASARVVAWARAVELCSARAALLAAGSSEFAAKMTRKYPLGGLGPAEDQVKDLLAYSVSDEYADLRARIGVAIQR